MNFTTSSTFRVPAPITELIVYGRGHSTTDSDLVPFPLSVTLDENLAITVTALESSIGDGTNTLVTFPNGTSTAGTGEIIIQWID